jgi:hypothetical protein
MISVDALLGDSSGCRQAGKYRCHVPGLSLAARIHEVPCGNDKIAVGVLCHKGVLRRILVQPYEVNGFPFANQASERAVVRSASSVARGVSAHPADEAFLDLLDLRINRYLDLVLLPVSGLSGDAKYQMSVNGFISSRSFPLGDFRRDGLSSTLAFALPPGQRDVCKRSAWRSTRLVVARRLERLRRVRL